MNTRVFFIFVLFSLLFFFTGCGWHAFMRESTSVADGMSTYDEIDTLIAPDLQASKGWGFYEIWMNENVSGGIFGASWINSKSIHSKIITSPVFLDEKDPKGVNNQKVINEWLNWLASDNSDICYLAYKQIASGMNYTEAYDSYRDHFKETVNYHQKKFQEAIWNKTEVLIKMPNPDGVIKNSEITNPLDIVSMVMNQSRRGLKIIRGVAQFSK